MRNETREIADYVQALSSGDSCVLRELALSRGYDEEFNVPERSLMSETSDRRMKFYAATRLMPAYIMGPTVSHKVAIKRQMEKPPKEYWEGWFNDKFTNLKRTDEGIYFVDCWSNKTGRKKGKLNMSTGLFPRREKLTEDEHIITNLVGLRENGLSNGMSFGYMPHFLIIPGIGSMLGAMGGQPFGREDLGGLIGAGVGLATGVYYARQKYLADKAEKKEKEKTLALGEKAIERLVTEIT